MINLKEAQELLDGATPGPWHLDSSIGSSVDFITVPNHVVAQVSRVGDAKFILNSRGLVEELMDEVKRLRNERLQSWLRWADKIIDEFGPYTPDRLIPILRRFGLPEELEDDVRKALL